MKNGEEESTNTFLSSSLQQSPSTESSAKEEIPVIEETNASKENVNQIISTNVPDDDHNEIEPNKELISDVSDEKKEEEEEQRLQQITPVTPSSTLNPDANPFLALSTAKIESTQSISSGDESDDEKDSNETPISSGK